MPLRLLALSGLLLTAGLAAGCDSSDPDGDGETADAAVLVAMRFSTPDGRVNYMGAFPDVPSAPVDISQLTELDGFGVPVACGGDVLWYNGADNSVTKYLVGDDLRLTRGESVLVGQEGIEGFTGAVVCAEATRAYVFAENGTRGVEINPQTMTITEGFDLPALAVEDGVDVQLFEPTVAGPLVYFPVGAVNYDTFEQGAATVGSFDTRDGSWVWTYAPGCAQGLSGYAFSCPDMIGGGEYGSFLSASTIDQELVVRSAQASALMPMMQFSVAPWRILDTEHHAAVKSAVALRERFEDRIMALAQEAAVTGEPIVRPMEYVFPHVGYQDTIDQFMLGDDVLVAPVLEPRATSRTVMIPPGMWRAWDGTRFSGPRSVALQADLSTLPYFERVR